MKVTQTVVLNFSDYFSKYGFDDGSPRYESVAFQFRPVALRALRKEIRKAKLMSRCTVFPVDVTGGHNSCRIGIRWDGQDVSRFLWYEAGEIPEELAAVIARAKERFEKESEE